MQMSGRVRVGRAQAGRNRRQGYVLLAIILILALIVIAAAAAAPDIAMSIRREREAELINRGTQYMRAIQHYYKKFGRYPMRIEDLENTNNMRFLRRRYKDPITGKDFKLLHFGEVQVFATNAVGTPVSQMGGQSGFPSGMAGAAAMQNSGLSPAALAQQGGLGQGVGGGVQMASTDNGQPGTSGTQPSGIQNNNSGNPNQQVFGGGAIIGVASTSDKIGIHEFNKKKKYSEWQFVYDPNLDRGGLIVGPAQPAVGGVGGVVQGQAGQQAQPGSNP